jgi:hypothetical protein
MCSLSPTYLAPSGVLSPTPLHLVAFSQSLHVSAVRVKGKVAPVRNDVLKHCAKKTWRGITLKAMLKEIGFQDGHEIDL